MTRKIAGGEVASMPGVEASQVVAIEKQGKLSDKEKKFLKGFYTLVHREGTGGSSKKNIKNPEYQRALSVLWTVRQKIQALPEDANSETVKNCIIATLTDLESKNQHLPEKYRSTLKLDLPDTLSSPDSTQPESDLSADVRDTSGGTPVAPEIHPFEGVEPIPASPLEGRIAEILNKEGTTFTAFGREFTIGQTVDFRNKTGNIVKARIFSHNVLTHITIVEYTVQEKSGGEPKHEILMGEADHQKILEPIAEENSAPASPERTLENEGFLENVKEKTFYLFDGMFLFVKSLSSEGEGKIVFEVYNDTHPDTFNATRQEWAEFIEGSQIVLAETGFQGNPLKGESYLQKNGAILIVKELDPRENGRIVYDVILNDKKILSNAKATRDKWNSSLEKGVVSIETARVELLGNPEKGKTYLIGKNLIRVDGVDPSRQTMTLFNLRDGLSLPAISYENWNKNITFHGGEIQPATDDDLILTGDEEFSLAGKHFKIGGTFYCTLPGQTEESQVVISAYKINPQNPDLNEIFLTTGSPTGDLEKITVANLPEFSPTPKNEKTLTRLEYDFQTCKQAVLEKDYSGWLEIATAFPVPKSILIYKTLRQDMEALGLSETMKEFVLKDIQKDPENNFDGYKKCGFEDWIEAVAPAEGSYQEFKGKPKEKASYKCIVQGTPHILYVDSIDSMHGKIRYKNLLKIDDSYSTVDRKDWRRELEGELVPASEDDLILSRPGEKFSYWGKTFEIGKKYYDEVNKNWVTFEKCKLSPDKTHVLFKFAEEPGFSAFRVSHLENLSESGPSPILRASRFDAKKGIEFNGNPHPSEMYRIHGPGQRLDGTPVDVDFTVMVLGVQPGKIQLRELGLSKFERDTTWWNDWAHEVSMELVTDPAVRARFEREIADEEGPKLDRAPFLSDLDEMFGSPEILGQLSDDEVIRKYLMYADTDFRSQREKDSSPIDETARRYVQSFRRVYEDPRYLPIIEKIRDQYEQSCRTLNINQTRFGRSDSWIHWDMAKQLYMEEHRGETDTRRYDIGNPLENVAVQRSIADRHLGWELYAYVNEFEPKKDAKGLVTVDGKIVFERTKYHDKNSTILRKLDRRGRGYQQIFDLLEKQPKTDTLSSSDLSTLGRLVRENLEAPSSVEDERHHLYDEAVKLFQDSGTLTRPSLQRLLGVGYNAAIRIVEQLKQDRVIRETSHRGTYELIREDETEPSSVALPSESASGTSAPDDLLWGPDSTPDPASEPWPTPVDLDDAEPREDFVSDHPFRFEPAPPAESSPLSYLRKNGVNFDSAQEHFANHALNSDTEGVENYKVGLASIFDDLTQDEFIDFPNATNFRNERGEVDVRVFKEFWRTKGSEIFFEINDQMTAHDLQGAILAYEPLEEVRDKAEEEYQQKTKFFSKLGFVNLAFKPGLLGIGTAALARLVTSSASWAVGLGVAATTVYRDIKDRQAFFEKQKKIDAHSSDVRTNIAESFVNEQMTMATRRSETLIDQIMAAGIPEEENDSQSFKAEIYLRSLEAMREDIDNQIYTVGEELSDTPDFSTDTRERLEAQLLELTRRRVQLKADRALFIHSQNHASLSYNSAVRSATNNSSFFANAWEQATGGGKRLSGKFSKDKKEAWMHHIASGILNGAAAATVAYALPGFGVEMRMLVRGITTAIAKGAQGMFLEQRINEAKQLDKIQRAQSSMKSNDRGYLQQVDKYLDGTDYTTRVKDRAITGALKGAVAGLASASVGAIADEARLYADAKFNTKGEVSIRPPVTASRSIPSEVPVPASTSVLESSTSTAPSVPEQNPIENAIPVNQEVAPENIPAVVRDHIANTTSSRPAPESTPALSGETHSSVRSVVESAPVAPQTSNAEYNRMLNNLEGIRSYREITDRNIQIKVHSNAIGLLHESQNPAQDIMRLRDLLKPGSGGAADYENKNIIFFRDARTPNKLFLKVSGVNDRMVEVTPSNLRRIFTETKGVNVRNAYQIFDRLENTPAPVQASSETPFERTSRILPARETAASAPRSNSSGSSSTPSVRDVVREEPTAFGYGAKTPGDLFDKVLKGEVIQLDRATKAQVVQLDQLYTFNEGNEAERAKILSELTQIIRSGTPAR